MGLPPSPILDSKLVYAILYTHNESFYHLSEEEMLSFTNLAYRDQNWLDEQEIIGMAELTKTTDDERLYWAAIQSFEGIISCLYDDENKEKHFTELFNNHKDSSEKFGNKPLSYDILTKAVIQSATTHPDIAPTLAFGLYMKMSYDDKFWREYYDVKD